MHRLFPLLLLFFIALPASAEKVVAVHWDYRISLPGGAKIRHETPASYLERLRLCGYIPASRELTTIPTSVLRCEGVLNFSESAAIRKRLKSRLAAKISTGIPTIHGIKLANLIRASEKVDFALSPYGLFESGLQIGSPRRVAVNIADLRLVIINGIYYRQFDTKSLDALLFHELLGALGYDDQDYNTSMEFVDGVSSLSAGEKVRVAHEEGGASVVGRGGDSTQLFFKASLMAAAKKEIQLLNFDSRLTPTRAELEAVIKRAAVTTAPAAFFAERASLCLDNNGQASPFACGGFTLVGATGEPFLLISETWAEFSQEQKQVLVLKVMSDIVNELVKAKVGGSR